MHDSYFHSSCYCAAQSYFAYFDFNTWNFDLIIRATKLCILAAHDLGTVMFKVTGHSVTGYRSLSLVLPEEWWLLASEYTASMYCLF